MKETRIDLPPRLDVEEGEIIAQQVFAISRLTPVMMTANVVNVLATLFALSQDGPLEDRVIVWGIVGVVFAVLLKARWFWRLRRPFPKSLSRRTRNKVVLFAGVLGAIWAYPGLFVLPEAGILTQGFLVALAAGMVSGGAIALYPVPSAAFLYSGVIAAGYLVGFALTGQPIFLSFIAVACAFFYAVARSVLRHEQIFVSEFRTRRELDERNALIAQLLDETRSEADVQQRESEARLAQVQKLDAVGRLTAGVAHDFNNLLAVIMGNLELMQIVRKDEERTELIEAALASTKRGADLTKQLLAFGRKAPLAPETINPATVISEMYSLLRRTLPTSIRIGTDLPPDACHVRVDRSQLENAILNLCINARDAMPEGGAITLSVRCVDGSVIEAKPEDGDAHAGAHVMVGVRDTGTGIPPDHLDRVFEPFYTTKPVGEGSGLGLAMVYGFAKQSGGHAEVESEPGRGTQIRLYFPAFDDAQGTSETEPELPVAKATESARILVVDDSADVRSVIAHQLRTLGYTVLEAEDGATALETLRTRVRIDLLLTDVVMPGAIQGADLMLACRKERPDTRVILMSGYPKDALDGHRDAIRNVTTIIKPIPLVELERLVRTELEPKDNERDATGDRNAGAKR
ncbi:ATP-binding protein [uncultured Jannaschia sp.]|uniref:ATP-binding protein n=1 Tax=uncultured Jannaschia sp. TaxID=293347 RepID=UPI00261A6A92|nr:ATP-binding protein [uncultured Jannaschia sp.]